MPLVGFYTHPAATVGPGSSSSFTIDDKQVITFDESVLISNLNVDDLINLTGMPAGSTNLGTFTGSTISDSQTIKGALQELETQVETNETNITTLLGSSHAAVTLGAGNSTALALAGQQLTFTEATLITNIDYDDLIDLTGVPQGWNDLGSFPGSTISDNATIKIALQELELALEATGATGTDLAYVASPTNGTVTSNTGTDATLTLADVTNAGLLTPADFTKLSFITITQAVDLDTVESDVAGLLLDVADLVTLSGVAANSTDLGTFAGSTISDNVTIKTALQQLETAVEGISGVTNLGYTASPTDGTVTSDTGTDATLPLATGVNAGLLAPADFTKLGHITITQAVDLDNVEQDLADVITLTGVAANSTNLGTFTGTTITDNVTIKVALQELETFAESISGSTNLGYTASPTDGTVTSDTGTDATLPLATGVNAGLLAPADFTKLGFISITQAVDLDNVEQDLADVITLTGVAANSTNLGTFTGATITDNVTIKVALQELETAVEALTLDHGGLNGLGDDDHTQYALLLGRTGGQTLIGGDAASNNLTLRSTSNVTKGNVIIEGPHLADEDDATKLVDVNLSAITTATTRTWTVPDRDIDFTANGTFQEDISGLSITGATVAGTDKVLIQDTDDSDNLKTVTAQSIADLTAVTINNDVNNYVLTAMGTGQFNGEANLTFDGTLLTVTGEVYIYGDGTQWSAVAGADDLFILKNSTSAGMTIGTSSTGSCNIYFGDDSSAGIGRIIYDHSVNDLSFWTNSTERITIASDGSIDFVAYGSASFTGTAAQILAVDASGNVIEEAASGFTYNADTDVSSNSWVLDEDDMASDDATKVPTQQSVKAYVDGLTTTWTEVTGTSQSMAVNSGYIANNVALVTLTLPDTAAIGDRVRVVGKGAGLYRIAQNAGETIRFSGDSTTTGVGGSLTAVDQYDAIELVCITANTDWAVLSSVGNFTVV